MDILLSIAAGAAEHAVPALAEEGGAGLQINLFWIIVSSLNFLLFLFLISRFAFGPINQILESRRERIEQGLKDAEQARRDRENAEKERAAALQEARREANEIRRGPRRFPRRPGTRISLPPRPISSGSGSEPPQRSRPKSSVRSPSSARRSPIWPSKRRAKSSARR